MTIRISYKQPVGEGVYRWTIQKEVPVLNDDVVEYLRRDAASDGTAITQIMLAPELAIADGGL